jgi:hypothetical protein
MEGVYITPPSSDDPAIDSAGGTARFHLGADCSVACGWNCCHYFLDRRVNLVDRRVDLVAAEALIFRNLVKFQARNREWRRPARDVGPPIPRQERDFFLPRQMMAVGGEHDLRG